MAKVEGPGATETLASTGREGVIPTGGETDGIGAALRARAVALGQEAVRRYCRRHPELAARWSSAARSQADQDGADHVLHLAEAIERSEAALFERHLAWTRSVLLSRGLPPEMLTESLEDLAQAAEELLPGSEGETAARQLRDALHQLPAWSADLTGGLDPGGPQAALAGRYLETLLQGDRRGASRLILDAAEAISIRELYLHVFQPALREIGLLWQTNRITVAQEHYFTASTQVIMGQLYPRLFSSERNGGRMVAACVGGDLHEIGLRMVADFFEMAGWDTYFLGANTPLDSVVRIVLARQAHLLAVSVTMSYHLPAAAALVEAVRARPECAGVRILVGGRPFSTAPGLWRKIGADACAADAEGAVRAAASLVHL